MKNIENITIGDMMYQGGKVELTMQSEGLSQDWYDYKGVKVTSHHPVLDEDNIWKPVFESKFAKKIPAEDIVYTLINTNHLMITENNIVFTDYAIVDKKSATKTKLDVIDKDWENFRKGVHEEEVYTQLIEMLRREQQW